METNLSLFSSKPVLTLTSTTKPCFGLPKKPSGSSLFLTPRSKVGIFSLSNPNNKKKLYGFELFASTSRSVSNNNKVEETMTTSSSVGVNPPQPYSYSSSQVGSPLFWFGVGVAFSALFSFVSQQLKKYAAKQAMNMLMGQMNPQNNQFGNPPYSPFPYPPPPSSGQSTPGFPFQSPYGNGQSTSTGFPNQPPYTSGASTSTGSATFSAPVPPNAPSYSTSQAAVGVDVSATKVEAAERETVTDKSETKPQTKQSAFVDISPEETFEKSPFEEFSDSSSQVISPEVVQNGTAFKEETTSQGGDSTGKRSILSVEALEKMLEDPKVQQMIYPQLPEEMRNPETFKWMMQNPVYRQQLQQMLDNMTGSPEWDSRMLENLRNFDINSPDVKEQFDQLGVTPEEMISKIMANPDVAMAFQNPRIQQALIDLSNNPWNIAKYQNDQEVMAVFMKLQQLFPGMGGAGGGF